MALTLNNNLASLKPGDYVWCKYAAPTSGSVGIFSDFATKLDADVSSNLIPVASSATPNGYFKFICVGYDIKNRIELIADRNIQTNISWDTINTVGITDEINLNLLYTKLNSNLSTETYLNAFDGNVGSGPTVSTNTNFDFSFNSKVKLMSYDFYYQSSVANYMPKSWILKGSNDGTNWINISSETNAAWPAATSWTKFIVQNPDYYQYYRIIFTSTIGGGSSIYIYDTNLYGYIQNQFISTTSYTSSIRLMTGGTSSTDTDDEWDQIIVNSTLNNTIAAGDNNIWNWNTATFSWTNTTNPSGGGTTKTVRGSTYIYGSSCPTTSSSGTAYGFRPVLLIQISSTPIFTGNLLSNSIHNQDAILTGSISNSDGSTNKIQYKILLNDTQIYPASGYTNLTIPPISINYDISNSLLTGVNNKITIINNNDLNKISSNDFYVTLYNNVPTGILSLSNTTTHANNIELTGNITDTDLDKISYRVLINDIEKLTWTNFATDPYIDYTILNSDLTIGDNIIKVEYKDNYKNIGLGTWTNILTKTNNTSIINIQYVNGSLIGVITDPDSDLIQYKILINGIQKYPELGYTDFEQICNINYQINRNDILINQNNIVTIIAQDNFGGNVSQDISFIGDYIGLMFMDENMKFYTTDIGQLLKYLDFGTITLGQITEPVKILVQNKFGFSIKDINLMVDNQLENINIELCKENNPFIAADNLVLENSYNPNDIGYFYIRLNTSISSNSVNGTFRINAKATAI